jgi:FtsZ-interacting cell division protein ZipA
MADVAVPNLGSGIDEFLTRLRVQRTARANVDQLFGGGGSDSGSADPGVVKVTQVASNSQKWAIVKYVIIGVLIVAGLGVILYFVFNTGAGKDLREQVKNNVPLGDRTKLNSEKSRAHSVATPSGTPVSSPSPPPPPPIRSSVVNPYNQPHASPQPANYAQQGSMRLESREPYKPPQPVHNHANPAQQSQPQPHAQPQPQPRAQPQPQPQPRAQPQLQPQPQAQPQLQPLKLVPRVQNVPTPAPKPDIGNIGGLPGPL